MAVRRKSNWYIYLIALVASFALLGIFLGSIWGKIFPEEDENGNKYNVSRSDYRPSADINLTSLIMMTDMKAAVPVYYMLMNYQPRNEVIVFVPLRENTRLSYNGNTGSIYEMYDNYGAKGAAAAVGETLGIKIDHYIKFDRLSFIDFMDISGKVYVNVPSDITVKETRSVLKKEIIEDENGEKQEVSRTVPETTEKIIFAEGVHYMDGETLYKYMTYNFGRGVDYSLAIQGSAAMNAVNKNFRGLSSTQLQRLAEEIIKSTETDIVFEDYAHIQSVVSYTTENSINPCEYYIPYGDDDGGYFVISESSRATMLDRMDIKTEESGN